MFHVGDFGDPTDSQTNKKEKHNGKMSSSRTNEKIISAVKSWKN